jgi:membrane associated rhomboid family serine protease
MQEHATPILSDEPTRGLLFSGPSKAAFDLSLMLASQREQHWIEVHLGDFELWVPIEKLERLQKLQHMWLIENKREEITLSELPTMSFKPFLALWFLVALYIYNRSGGHWAMQTWGHANSEKILDGAWWQTLTALTLHADAGHIASNLLSGYFVLNLLQKHIDIGRALFALTISSALANFFVAFDIGPGHYSLGFSTLVFGSLGMLASLETRYLIRAKTAFNSKWDFRKLSPLWAAICLVAMMGFGEGSDVRAHVYGFAMGALAGLVFWKSKNSKLNFWFLGLSYAFYGTAWLFAINAK